MELRARKKLRLENYGYDKPGCYFVTICVKDRHNILWEPRRLSEMGVGADVLIGPPAGLSQIGKIVESTIEQMPCVDKYVVMPNHIHLILRIFDAGNGPMGTSAPTQSLPQVVRYLKRSVTIVCGFNIWQRSYHDHIIRNDADYLSIWEYINTNPAKWREDCYYTEDGV